MECDVTAQYNECCNLCSGLRGRWRIKVNDNKQIGRGGDALYAPSTRTVGWCSFSAVVSRRCSIGSPNDAVQGGA